MFPKGQPYEFDGDLFLKIVKTAFSGESCNKWTQVARKYELQTGQKIIKTQELRRKFDLLNDEGEKFTDEEKLFMFKIDIQARGNKKQALVNFKNQIKQNKKSEIQNKNALNIYQGRFFRIATSHLRIALQQIIEVFDNPRKINQYVYSNGNKRRLEKIGYPCIYLLLRVQDVFNEKNTLILQQLSKFEKWIVDNMMESSINCEKLMLLYCECHAKDRQTRYEQYSQLVNRRKFKKFIFFLKYLDQLRKIHMFKFVQPGVTNHPLIHPDPEKNKESVIYKNLIVQCDWNDKYTLFNECIATQVQEEDMTMLIKKKQNDGLQERQNDKQNRYDFMKNKEHQLFRKQPGAKLVKTKKKSGQMTKFRGQLLTPGDHKNMDRLTRTFNCEDDSEYDENIQNIELQNIEAEVAEKTRIEKLQDLYNEAFLKIPNQRFQHYYQDKQNE